MRESLRERAIILRLAPHLLRTLPIYLPRSERRLPRGVHDLRPARGRRERRTAPARRRGGARPCRAGARAPRRRLRLPRVCDRRRAADARDRARGRSSTVRSSRTTRASRVCWAKVASPERSSATSSPARRGDPREDDRQRNRRLVGAASVARHGQLRDATSRARASTSSSAPAPFAPARALLVPSGEDDRRFVFVIPWEDRYYAGTTDTAYEGDLEAPAVEQNRRRLRPRCGRAVVPAT